MSGCCVGWSGKEGRTEGRRKSLSSVADGIHRTDGRTDTDGWPGKGGDEVEKEGRAKNETTRRKRSERSEM